MSNKLKYLKTYFKQMVMDPGLILSMVIALVVGIAGVYNLGWKIDYTDHPLIFIIIGWIVSIVPFPALLYLNYLNTKKRIERGNE